MGHFPPVDSPLTKVFLGPFVSLLIQETITCLKMSYKRLAMRWRPQRSYFEMRFRESSGLLVHSGSGSLSCLDCRRALICGRRPKRHTEELRYPSVPLRRKTLSKA